MIFIEWWLVWRFAVSILLILGGLSFGTAAKQHIPPALRALSMPAGFVGLLFLLLNIAAARCQIYSEPVYSPDGKSAARVRSSSVGGIPGGTEIELFTAHGLNSDSVFSGAWKAVAPEDIQWVSNSDLTVGYTGSKLSCKSTDAVNVRCTPLIR